MALNQFKSAIKNKTEFGNDGYKFEGLVTYSAKGKIETEILDVVLIVGGFEPTIKLDIDFKGRILTSTKYHLDFNPKFSKNTLFVFDESKKSITITGTNSPKLGDYEVTIVEA
ncbi:hypothetical protein [Flavobacterium notoginsengisoli]|uniref:hypothetical protein n=1 Tax=Flavobacterium notoginsengisoli TaxID=1478199 RepID=UPI0036420809